VADLVSEVSIFDANGRIDIVASDEANKEIFSEENTVKTAGGVIDAAATAAKNKTAKDKVLNRKK
jgi:hypothetical protein